VVVFLTFFIARKLFDAGVGWLSAILVLGCNALAIFHIGMSTILLCWPFFCDNVVHFENRRKLARGLEPRGKQCLIAATRGVRRSRIVCLGFSIALGVLTGVGALTRYAFGWAIIPVAVF